MKSALLFLNGQVGDPSFARIRSQSYDVIIAADGGANHAAQGDHEPQVIIGDLDSVTPAIRQRFLYAEWIHLSSQKENDLEKSLSYCRDIRVTHLTIVGLCGKRLDHTINNFSVLLKYDQYFKLTLFDDYSRIFIVRDQWEYSGPVGQTISLIPLGHVDGVTTEGLGFPLRGETLALGIREGASNVITDNPVRVRIGRGVLLVFVVDETGKESE